MLGIKERALREDLKRWQKLIKKMIGELDRALTPGRTEDLENEVTLRKCLDQLKNLRQEINYTIERQEHGAWIM